MRGAPREKLAILQRRKAVAALWLSGQEQWEIAETLKVTVRTIERDMAAIKAQWQAEHQSAADIKIMEAVAHCDRVRAESYAAWERSKQDAELRSAKTVKVPDGQDAAGKPRFKERSEASKREEGQCGDPRFLAEIRACVRQRCELLGLLVTKLAPVTPDGKEAAKGVQVIYMVPRNGREIEPRTD